MEKYVFETNVEEYKYKIEYSKNDNLSCNIYFKNDNSILVKKLRNNNVYDIINEKCKCQYFFGQKCHFQSWAYNQTYFSFFRRMEIQIKINKVIPV